MSITDVVTTIWAQVLTVANILTGHALLVGIAAGLGLGVTDIARRARRH